MRLIGISLLFLLAGCSVYKAADVQGVTVDDIHKCDSRDCFFKLGSQVIETTNSSDGGTETLYKVKRKNGNSGRAFVYGVADVFSLGLWEVVGTPLEGYISDSDSIVYKVDYSKKGQVRKTTIQGS